MPLRIQIFAAPTVRTIPAQGNALIFIHNSPASRNDGVIEPRRKGALTLVGEFGISASASKAVNRSKKLAG